jgi:hypothetical protein
MRRFLPLLLILLLSGCYSDQKQQLSACELQAKQHNIGASESIDVQDQETSEYIELCMRAHGYEIVQDGCPDNLSTDLIPRPDPEFYHSLNKEQQARLNLETGRKIRKIEGLQKIEPECYEPMGWFGKRSLRYEKKWLGISN